MNLYIILTAIIAYLICSFNPAIYICKKKTGQDIRKLGSGTAGSANSMRVLGRMLGTLVVIIDILKVVVSYAIIYYMGKIFGNNIDETVNSVFIVSVIIGHCFPIYYGFKGGKGVVVGIVCAVILSPKVALVCIIAGAILIMITKTVSIGTLGGVILYAIMALIMMPKYIIPVCIMSVIVMYKHRANIQRLLTRQEGKIK